MIKIYERLFFCGKEKIEIHPNTTDISYYKRIGFFRVKMFFWATTMNKVEIQVCGLTINKFGFYENGQIKLIFFRNCCLKLSLKYSCNKLYYILGKYIAWKLKSNQFNAILLNIASGEPFLYMAFLDEYIKKNNLKDVVVLFFEGRDKIVKVYNFKSLKVHHVFMNLDLCDFDVKTIRILYHRKYYIDLENNIRMDSRTHFHTELIRHIGLDEKKIKYKKPVISRDAQISCLFKLQQFNKDLVEKSGKCFFCNKPIIFIIPETTSIQKLDGDFLSKIVGELKLLGYEIIFNTLNESELRLWNKELFLNHEEVLFLSDIAYAVIGVRSGLFDIISSTKSKKFIVYYGMPHRGQGLDPLTCDEVKRAFSLMKLPFVNKQNIFEYDGEKNTKKEICEHIISVIKKNHKKIAPQKVFDEEICLKRN